MNNNIFTTINEIDFDKIAVTNVDELCLEENLNCGLLIERKLRNIIIIFVTIVLKIHGEIINDIYHKIINDLYYIIELSIIDMFSTKKILKYKKMHKRKLRNFTIGIVLKKGKKNWMNKICNYDFILCGMLFIY